MSAESKLFLQARGGAGLVVTPQGSVYVIAGFCGEEMNDCHRFDLNTSKWDDPAACQG